MGISRSEHSELFEEARRTPSYHDAAAVLHSQFIIAGTNWADAQGKSVVAVCRRDSDSLVHYVLLSVNPGACAWT